MVSPSVLITRLVIWLICMYQIIASPVLGHHCRFSVTCSQYGINSIRRFGIFRGVWKTCVRIFRCHPYNTTT